MDGERPENKPPPSRCCLDLRPPPLRRRPPAESHRPASYPFSKSPEEEEGTATAEKGHFQHFQ